MKIDELIHRHAASAYFGVEMPAFFLNFLERAVEYSAAQQLEVEDLLYDLFELLRMEGHQARYPQTPPEFFPFATNGSDGEHFGYIVHLDDGSDHPMGALCPMDGDGATFLGDHTLEGLQNLLTSEDGLLQRHEGFIAGLGLVPGLPRNRYAWSNPIRRPMPQTREGWSWRPSSDGVGVFAPDGFFLSNHITLDQAKGFGTNPVEYFFDLAEECSDSAHWATSLYYLKEAFWWDWTNADTAIAALSGMKDMYERMDREHLFNAAKRILQDFETTYKYY